MPSSASKAESAIAALASSVRTDATVLRDGQKVQVLSTELVPGDLVLLASGDKVPADLRLLQVRNLQVNESALTGESVAVQKESRPLVADTPLAERFNMAYAFARVAPEQKLRLVEDFQSRGEVVAMTGDGVNDAPVLRQADIGIAMGRSGTEVAKEAADMILTDDNFASIAAAVEEGRTVYRNVLKAIAFILPVNGGESMTILLSVLLARELPILALQVLWLNMVNSIAMTVPLACEPKSDRVMQRPPRHPNEPLLSRRLLQRILVISVFNWVLIFGVFEWIRQTTGDVALARTMAVQALVAGRIFYLLRIVN
jgi:cation-transporting P-type ATPase F